MLQLTSMRIRRFDPADAPTVCEIFYRSIHEVVGAKSDQVQLNVWAPKVPQHGRWLQRLSDYETCVADNEAGKAVGWISMSRTGYVDMIFCLPEATRCAVAGALYSAVEQQAVTLGLSQLTAHASLLAQPFFKRRGWLIENFETIVRNGVDIPRAMMSKSLAQ